MASIQEYETDGLGARWHRVHIDPISILCRLAPWQLARDAVDAGIADGSVEVTDGPTLVYTLHDRIVTEQQRLTRADHSWFHVGRTKGDTDSPSPVPDPIERVRAKTRKVRTRKGVSVDEVTVHGRAYVIGATDRRDPRWHGPVLEGHVSMSRERMTAALETVPRAGSGRDAINIYRMTQCLYGDSIPRLIGADVIAYEEWQDGGSVRVGQYRPVRFPTRTRLAAIHVRKNESADRVTFHDGQTVTRLLSPDADPDYAWKGHRLYLRPVTVRERADRRARPVTMAATIHEDQDLALTLAMAAAAAAPGDRITYTQVDDSGRPVGYRGALTVTGSDKRPRFSVTGLGAPIRNYATTDGLAQAIARTIA